MLGDEKKKQIGETRDVLDAIGHENEKQGIKWTKYFMDQWDKQEWEKQQITQDRLKKRARFKRLDYHRLLSEVLREMVYGIERPNWGWWAEIGFDQGGVWVKLRHRTGRLWQRGFKPSGVPKIDHQAATAYAAFTEDTMWAEENNPSPKTPGGIYIAK